LLQTHVIYRVVLDWTGLEGTFDFSVQVAAPLVGPFGIPDFNLGPEVAPPDPSNTLSIFTVLRDQLGLKLVPATGPVDCLVIDCVERSSPN
jgi:uncharacterized protein (TIGR03435 family)